MESTPQDLRINSIQSAIGCLTLLRSKCRRGEIFNPNDEALVESVIIECLLPLESMLFFTGAEQQIVDGVPRRVRVDLMEPAELAIRHAVDFVERLPADVRLTQAVTLLAAARERVADYVDAAHHSNGACAAADDEELMLAMFDRDPVLGRKGRELFDMRHECEPKAAEPAHCVECFEGCPKCQPKEVRA